MKLRPIGRKIIVRKCYTGEKEVVDGETRYKQDGLYLIDRRGEHQHWCEIVDVSDGCLLFDRSLIGRFVWIPEYAPNKLYRIPDYLLGEGDEDFVVCEQMFDDGRIPALIVEM